MSLGGAGCYWGSLGGAVCYWGHWEAPRPGRAAPAFVPGPVTMATAGRWRPLGGARAAGPAPCTCQSGRAQPTLLAAWPRPPRGRRAAIGRGRARCPPPAVQVCVRGDRGRGAHRAQPGPERSGAGGTGRHRAGRDGLGRAGMRRSGSFGGSLIAAVSRQGGTIATGARIATGRQCRDRSRRLLPSPFPRLSAGREAARGAGRDRAAMSRQRPAPGRPGGGV